jgi:hypothetical protein
VKYYCEPEKDEDKEEVEAAMDITLIGNPEIEGFEDAFEDDDDNFEYDDPDHPDFVKY